MLSDDTFVLAFYLFDTLMVLLKYPLQKNILKKISDNKKHAKLPSMPRVKPAKSRTLYNDKLFLAVKTDAKLSSNQSGKVSAKSGAEVDHKNAYSNQNTGIFLLAF